MSTSEGTGQALDVRLVPSAIAAWLGAALGLTGSPLVWALLAVVAMTVLVRVLRGGWTSAAALVVALGAGLVSAGWTEAFAASSPAGWAEERAVVEVEARVSADVRIWQANGVRPQFATVPLRLTSLTARGGSWQGSLPAELLASGPLAGELAGQQVGATICFTARLRPAETGQRSVGRLQLRGPITQVAAPNPGDRLANRFRTGLQDAMANAPPEQGGLVPSLVVGDTSRLSEQLRADFRATGLTHLTAVSGTNLTLMLVFALAVARGLGVRGWWLRGSGVAVTAAFVVVCRAEPSVLRAAAMGLVALAATGLAGDRQRGIRALAGAVILLLLIDPWLATNWGFALSVSATAGILWWGTGWQLLLRRWAPGWLAESLAVPMAAQLATQPLVTALSGQVSVVGLAANMAAAPFVGPVTVLGLGAGLLSLVSPVLAGLVGWAAWAFVLPIVVVAGVGASAPAATWAWPAGPAGLLLLIALVALAAQLLVPRVLVRWWLVVGLGVVLFIAAWRPPPQPGWPGDWSVIACDVGQGGAQLIRAGTRSAVLVDTGPDARTLTACMRSAGVRQLAMLVITHPHADHVGGLAGLSGTPVSLVLAAPDAAGAAAVPGQWPPDLPAPRVTAAGDVVQIGDLRWTTLAAGPLGGDDATGQADNRAENDAGVVGLLDTGRIKVLVTGDLEEPGQRRVLATNPQLRADVLVVPHHGSLHQDEDFINELGAAIALIQVGADNDYGHPSPTTLAILERGGAAVFRTDQQGAIAVNRDATEVVTQR